MRSWEKRNSDLTITATTGESVGRSGSKREDNFVWRIGNEERLFRENHAKDCQDIEELRRIRCEETDPAGQARIGELSM